MNQVAIRDQNERTSIQHVAFGREAGGGNLAPQNLGDIVRFAEVMARADIAIPMHLRDNPGACLAVCMQAFKWEMDPFSVAQKSYKVGDQMAYEAQLIAAVINTRAGLKRRPQIDYQGEGGDRRCVVTFDAADGSTHIYQSPRFAAITTKNSPLWKSDPDQQLGYYSIRAGARRHFPEVILGVNDRDELEGARDVTPQDRHSGFATRISTARSEAAEGKREGFEHGFIDEQLKDNDADAGEIDRADQAPAGSEAPANEERAPADDGEAEQGQGDGDGATGELDLEGSESDSAEVDAYQRNLLAEAAEKFLTIAINGDLSKRDRQSQIGQSVQAWKQEIVETHHPRLKRLIDQANDVIAEKLGLDDVVRLISTELGCKPEDVKPRAR